LYKNREISHRIEILANAKDFKVSTHSTWAPNQKLGDLFKLFDDVASSQRPDGLIEATKLKHIFMNSHVQMAPRILSCERTLKDVSAEPNSISALRGKAAELLYCHTRFINEQQWHQQLTELK